MNDISLKEKGENADKRHTNWKLLLYHGVLMLLVLSALSTAIYSLYRTRESESKDTGKKIIQEETYRLWSLVSLSNDGLLLNNPSDNNVYCNGSFSGGSQSRFFMF